MAAASRGALDLTRWAVVGYCDDTGIGRMAQDIISILGVRHLAVPSERLETRSLRPGVDHLLPKTADAGLVRQLLAGVQGLILLEQWWNPHLLHVARNAQIPIACVPMWEWFRGTDEEWGLIQRFLCPSRHCLETVRNYGWRNSCLVPWTLDLLKLPRRVITGPARVFIHNAGLMDHDDRKSTRDTIRAFRRLRNRDVRLIVRLQKTAELGDLDDRIDVRVGNLSSPAELYAEGDVAVQPSTMEGIGFMVLEPVCCGLPTITLDYPPMSDHVAQPELRVRKRWFRRPAFPNRAARILHAHRRLPSIRDLQARMAWCTEHDLENISRANRRAAEHRFDADALRRAWSAALADLV